MRFGRRLSTSLDGSGVVGEDDIFLFRRVALRMGVGLSVAGAEVSVGARFEICLGLVACDLLRLSAGEWICGSKDSGSLLVAFLAGELFE